MLFVALPFLLALWEYNLINIVKRMSVVKKNAYIGVDLGGTNMRAGRIAGDRLVAQGNAPTPQDAADCGETLEALIEVIRSVWDEGVVAIGIGVPSVVDREKGIVYNVVNIPHWEEVHWRLASPCRFMWITTRIASLWVSVSLATERRLITSWASPWVQAWGVELSRKASCWPTLIVARESLA